MNVVVRGQVNNEISSHPVAVRVSKTRVLKLPINQSQLTSIVHASVCLAGKALLLSDSSRLTIPRNYPLTKSLENTLPLLKIT